MGEQSACNTDKKEYKQNRPKKKTYLCKEFFVYGKPNPSDSFHTRAKLVQLLILPPADINCLSARLEMPIYGASKRFLELTEAHPEFDVL